ncbi:MAG: hypothetical protein J3R72DRAFT_457481 [Linnemannia gamsii]|nr:MAG: hypothetical protein J3R72DRAFT_457481 [Linnemannia gamsii]
MLQHDYPAWHRPAQKGFFVVAVLLSIALPVVYGSSRRPRKISARTMGVVLGTYFGLWALFSLVARFLVPSPKIEPTLPTYTPSPIPVPAVLHSPSRPNAVPNSPAIRLHPTGSAVAPVATVATVPRSGSGPVLGAGPRVTITAPGGERRTARFADGSEGSDGENNSSPGSGGRNNNVTFQTRPRGYTTDSAHSAEFPTFAAYRQSQRGNFDALAQRFKRAFAISQQTSEQQQHQQQQQQMAMMQSPASSGVESAMTTDPPSYSQSTPDLSGSSPTGIPLTTTTLAAGTTRPTGTAGGTRSRSASAASMFSDIAGRLRAGSLFNRSNSIANITTATGNAIDPLQYTHISSGANSETISRPSLLPSSSVPYSSYPSSSSIISAGSGAGARTGPGLGLGIDVNSTATTISPETMPTLELLESQSPTSQTGHDRTPASTSSSSPSPSPSPLPTLVQTQSSSLPPPQEHQPRPSKRIQTNLDHDDTTEDEDVSAASSPQSQSNLVTAEKYPEKQDDSTHETSASPNNPHHK